MIAIGTNPTLTEKLRIQFSSGASSTTGIYSQNSGGSGSIYAYGIQGRATSSGYINYGIYGYASGAYNNWAGYFSGNVYTTGSCQSSDERLKKDIRSLDGKDILSKIVQLKPVHFQFLNETELDQKGLPPLNAKEGEHIGFLAQEVEKIFPEFVIDVVNPPRGENGTTIVITKAINYQELCTALVSAVQEQQARIEELEHRVAAMNK